MAGAEIAVALCFGGRGHYRLQRFAVQRPPLTQIGGFVNAPGRLGAGDPQAVGQRRCQLAAQLGLVGLFAELVDHRMLDGRQPAADLFATLQDRQPLGGGQRVAPQVQGSLEAGLERVEHLDDLVTITRTHVRILAKPADRNSPTNPRLWINVQL